MKHCSTWAACAFLLSLIAYRSSSTARAAEFNSNIPNGAVTNWNSPAIWTLVSGSDADGIPDGDDIVNMYPATWPYGYQLYIDSTNPAATLRVHATGGNNCTLYITNFVKVRTMQWYRAATNYSFRLYSIANNYENAVLAMAEFQDTGPLGIITFEAVPSFDSVVPRWEFEGDALIEYCTSTNAGHENVYSSRLDFSKASSVHLRRSTNSASLDHEFIRTAGGNTHCPIVLGRQDDGVQTWTVEEGSHPALFPKPTSQSAAFGKVGTNDVVMRDIDLIVDTSMYHPADNGSAISTDGKLAFMGGNMYTGTIYANSLTLRPSYSSTTRRRFQILGRLILDGQAGMQTGGSPNGCAFLAFANDTNLVINLSIPSAATRVGQMVIEDGGGRVHLDSLGPGRLELNINNNSRDCKLYTNHACLIAQTIFVGTNAYISDRNNWSETFSPGTAENDAGGMMEIRGSFSNATVLASCQRTEHTTVLCAGTAEVFEVCSADLGLAGPGSNNFAIGKLVVGLRQDGTTNLNSWVILKDLVNNPCDSTPDALYADSLLMYGHSILALNGLSLYYRNSGSWTKAIPGMFPYGDGTGRIISSWPPRGTLVTIR